MRGIFLGLMLLTGCVAAVAVRQQPRVVAQQGEFLEKTADGTYLLRAPFARVWPQLVEVLLKNYSISVFNREAGIITTEWDRFYYHDQIVRNKVSLLVVPLAAQRTRLTIHNNFEILSEASGAAGATWLPYKDHAGETERILARLVGGLGGRQVPEAAIAERPSAAKVW